MRLEIGARVECSNGLFGELVNVVIDPENEAPHPPGRQSTA